MCEKEESLHLEYKQGSIIEIFFYCMNIMNMYKSKINVHVFMLMQGMLLSVCSTCLTTFFLQVCIRSDKSQRITNKSHWVFPSFSVICFVIVIPLKGQSLRREPHAVFLDIYTTPKKIYLWILLHYTQNIKASIVYF